MDPSSEQKSFMQKLQERLAASRFFTFSLLLHVILVILGGSVVLFNLAPDPPDFTSDGGALVSGDVSVQPPMEQPPDMTQQQAPTPEAPSITAPVVAITTTATNNTSFQMASIQPQIKTIATDASKLSNVNPVSSKLGSGVPGAMAGRMGGTARASMMMKNNGKDKSEKAVMAGLRWLRDHQSEDGSWSNDYKPGMTGLALLCFLGHGELPESPEFGPTVKKALDWILSRGQEFQGRMSLTKDGFGGGNHTVYEHAILTYAMGEYYSMTKDERFAELLKQAVTYIVQGQTPLGGWDYHYNKGVRNDLSVAGWQIQALKAAHLTGLGITGVDEALDRAMVFIKKFQGNKGGFGYDKPENKPSLTGVGVLCTYFWKQDKDKVVKEGIDFLLNEADVKYNGPKADLYEWYYNTQACLMFGGSAWTKWNRLFQDEIADSQSPDGSWPPTQGGVGDLQKKPDGAGPYYRTTLCVLMLEVFYRYMPINK
jgi:hypothetical protein